MPVDKRKLEVLCCRGSKRYKGHRTKRAALHSSTAVCPKAPSIATPPLSSQCGQARPSDWFEPHWRGRKIIHRLLICLWINASWKYCVAGAARGTRVTEPKERRYTPRRPSVLKPLQLQRLP